MTAKLSQKERVLEELGKRDLSVREILTEMWINSPTKVISDLRKEGNNIIDAAPKGSRFPIYHLVKPVVYQQKELF